MTALCLPSLLDVAHRLRLAVFGQGEPCAGGLLYRLATLPAHSMLNRPRCGIRGPAGDAGRAPNSRSWPGPPRAAPGEQEIRAAFPDLVADRAEFRRTRSSHGLRRSERQITKWQRRDVRAGSLGIPASHAGAHRGRCSYTERDGTVRCWTGSTCMWRCRR